MEDKIKIKDTTIKGTEIVLWKNFTKNPSRVNYNITISKKGMLFLAISSINKKNLSFMVAKYDSVVEWINFMMTNEAEVD